MSRQERVRRIADENKKLQAKGKRPAKGHSMYLNERSKPPGGGAAGVDQHGRINQAPNAKAPNGRCMAKGCCVPGRGTFRLLGVLEPGLTGKTARNCFYGPGNGSSASSELFYGQGAIATKGAIANNRGQDRRASQLCSCFLRRIFSYLVNSSGSPSVQNCQMGVLFSFLAVGEDWRT